jgi:quinol monooxygenase YgiN
MLMRALNSIMQLSTINGCSVKPDTVQEVRTIFAAYAREVEDHEPGCLQIRFHQDAEDPCHFVVYAEFADQTAYEAHLASDHVTALRTKLHPLIGDSHHKTLLRTMK